MKIQEAQELLEYTEWANQLVLEAVSHLDPEQWSADFGGSFGTLGATVAHSIGAEWIWLQRWIGRSPTAPPDWVQNPVATELVAVYRELVAARGEWLAGLHDDDLFGDLEYRQLNGNVFTTPIHVVLRHVVNHATHHRGQIVHFLRALGEVPPTTDLIVWDRKRREQLR